MNITRPQEKKRTKQKPIAIHKTENRALLIPKDVEAIEDLKNNIAQALTATINCKCGDAIRRFVQDAYRRGNLADNSLSTGAFVCPVEKFAETHSHERRALFMFMYYAIAVADMHRVILAPGEEVKDTQTKVLHRIRYIKPHADAYGFAMNKNAYGCAKRHCDANDGAAPGVLIKIDIKDFFNSFSQAMVERSVPKNGIEQEYLDDILKSCMMNIGTQYGDIFTEDVDTLLVAIFTRTVEIMRDAFGISRNSNLSSTGYRAAAVSQIYSLMHDYKPQLIAHNILIGLKNLNELERKRLETCTTPYNEKVDIPSATLARIQRRFLLGRRTDPTSKTMFINVAQAFVDSVLKVGPKIRSEGTKMLYQGGSCSPAISNLCFKMVDYRVAAYANACGCCYTRYADDMCFSFKSRRGKKAINLFIYKIISILKESGFTANKNKTKVMGSGGQQKVVGYCINSGVPSVSKKYRRNIYMDIMNLLHKPKNKRTIEKDMMVLEGKISYLSLSNKEQAEKYRQMLYKVPISDRKVYL